jgi:hypothetical protein
LLTLSRRRIAGLRFTVFRFAGFRTAVLRFIALRAGFLAGFRFAGLRAMTEFPFQLMYKTSLL